MSTGRPTLETAAHADELPDRPADQIYMDKGLTGTNRQRPGLDQALAAVRAGDTLVVPQSRLTEVPQHAGIHHRGLLKSGRVY